MTGEKRLSQLLSHMSPDLLPATYVFFSVQHTYDNRQHVDHCFAMVREKEGTTFIVEEHYAKENNIPCESPMRCLSLTVHSSLEAVGLTAAMSNALANNDISANVIAGYFHDHIFVPEADAENALACLLSLSNDHRNK